jgi:GNAT superfamily N-acetyltransferase
VSEPPRRVYRLEPDRIVIRSLLDGLRLRTVTVADDDALARLMERAYAGTVDEDLGGNSDGAVEVADWRAPGALAMVSVAVVDTHDKLLAASMCSGSCDREVWIAYVITEPPWKGQSLGTAAVAESIRLVRERRSVDVFAVVTAGNVPSERLLAAVGFEPVGFV